MYSEEIVEKVSRIVDEMDLATASNSSMRAALQRITELVAEADEEVDDYGEDDDEEDEGEDTEEEIEEDGEPSKLEVRGQKHGQF